MRTDFDTRPWNLFASLALAAGCGSRLVGSDGAEGGSGTAGETDSPECVSDADCPNYYYCYANMCYYAYHHDGHLDHYDDGWYYECYSDEDCGELALCEFNYCSEVDSPPPCMPIEEQPIALAIPATPLALSFVDVDGDGAEELVVAGPEQLYVFERDSLDAPTASPRGMGSATVEAMAGGQLDAMPGEDVLVLAQDQLLTHLSDGLGGLVPAPAMPSPFANSLDLQIAELDGGEPSEVLVRAQQSVAVLNGVTLLDDNGTTHGAVIRGAETTAPGFAVMYGANALTFFDALGAQLDTVGLRDGVPTTLASVGTPAGTLDVSTTRIGSWTLFIGWGPSSANSMGAWGLLGEVSASEALDLSGDLSDDLALILDGRAWLLRDPLGLGCVEELGELSVELAAGDFDGDGDDELAVRTIDDAVLVYELD